MVIGQRQQNAHLQPRHTQAQEHHLTRFCYLPHELPYLCLCSKGKHGQWTVARSVAERKDEAVEAQVAVELCV